MLVPSDGLPFISSCPKSDPCSLFPIPYSLVPAPCPPHTSSGAISTPCA